MRIKKLELAGFKSFKDRTVIQFDAGITGIVGPNGCGKSNIVDALMWVMGDQSVKDLRASTMTDVIFAGADGYAPLGMCEVSLTLENDGGPFPAKYIKHSEIMVTRRLHRHGEGEYFINKEPARLKDVQEIFMDTGAGSKGFSIIAQGMIGKIITAKPEDRRMLIEEAAGITKFKARKKESQRKLIATDQNLVRLQDIIGELKRQIDSLQRQAQRAERYRTIKTQIEKLDLWLASKQYVDLKTAADEAQRIFNEAQSLEVEGESQLSGVQAEIEALRLQILEKEKQVEEDSQAFYDTQSLVQKKEMQIQELRFEIEQARRNEQMTGTILQEQQARQQLLQKEQSQYEVQAKELEVLSQELEKAYLEKNEIYQNSSSRIHTVDEDLTAQRREFFALGQTESSVSAKLQALQAQSDELAERQESEQLQLNEIRERELEYQTRLKKTSVDLDKERQLQLDLSSDVDSFEANKKVLSEQLQQKKQEVETFKDNLNEVTSMLYGLENLHSNFEGFQEGVKQVMLWQKQRIESLHADGSVSSYFQPVSEVIEVPSEYEVAMEAALGTRLQMLLSKESDVAVEAVDYLKSAQSGRSSFLSENVASSSSPRSELSANTNGVVALLKDVVQYSENYSAVVSQLLDGVAVVDSIKTALALRPEYVGWTFVTVDGDSLTADGVLTGGSREGAESGVLKRKREIKELSQRKDEWAGKLALATASMKKLQEQLDNVLQDFEGAQKRRVEQEIKVAELKKDLERAENELQNVRVSAERQSRECQKLQDQATQLQDKINELEEHLTEAREKKLQLESSIEALTQEHAQIRQGFDSLQAEVTDLKVRSSSKSQEYQGVLRQLEMVTKSLNDLNMQLERMSEEAQGYNSSMTESQVALEEQKIELEKMIHMVEAKKQSLSMNKDIFEQLSQQLHEKETAQYEVQKARNDRQSRMNESQLKLEQAKMKEQYLLDQVREKYMLQLENVFEEYLQNQPMDGSVVDVEVELKDLRERLAKIGEVNLSAIEEYSETAQRYEFLTKQHADLTEAKEQLRRVIERINKICAKRFKETFELVNDRFQKVFPVLFGGGEARLELIEDADKGEMGIDIIAKPPGKKMQNVSLMSGGEKALTAVSLVFSIFLVKPSPYCLLDEVDAPLDDANVYRFNDLVKEMAKRSQIIVVTHNKHTMEVAGKLYGVTMQERGVSTMVSVSLQDLR